MPTDLPPDYKPSPLPPKGPAQSPDGADVPGGVPQPGPGVGMPGPDGDVVDPPGWPQAPEKPGGNVGVPSPAGTPVF